MLIKLELFDGIPSDSYFYEIGIFLITFGCYKIEAADILWLGFTFKQLVMISYRSYE